MDNSIAVPYSAIPSAKSTKTIYLPGLNGFRAIAALAVVVSHTSLALGEFGLNNKILNTDSHGDAVGLDLAGSGVTIFFTLSGFLITYLLLKEKEISNLKINDFYIRRLLRIWPLYYLYFFICLSVIILFNLDYDKSSVPFYVFLAANVPFILDKTLPFLAHYWSLGVEEQFYLFFPQIARQSNRRLFKIVWLLIFLLLFAKLIFWFLHRTYAIELPFLAITVTRFHIMLIGVVGAILYYEDNKLFVALATHKITQIICWSCLLLVAVNKFHIASVLDAELISVFSLFLIVGQITKKNRLINLENNVCDFIGKISFGIYVIHPLLIFFYAKLLGRFSSPTLLNYLLIYFLVIATTIGLAYISYEYFEKYFLKLKSKFSTVASANTRQG